MKVKGVLEQRLGICFDTAPTTNRTTTRRSKLTTEAPRVSLCLLQEDHVLKGAAKGRGN